MSKILALALVLALTGCKADSKESTSSGSSAATGTENAPKGRSGKIDFGPRRAPSPGGEDDGAEDGAPTGQDLLEERRKARLAAIDTDGDGQISDAERAANRQRRAEDLRARMDSNGDGKVTVEELTSSRFRRFDPEAADANKDGDISVDELAKVLEERGKAWGVGRLRNRPTAGSGSAAGSGSGS